MDKQSKEEIKEGVAILFCPPVLFLIFFFSLVLYAKTGSWIGVLVGWLIAVGISAIIVLGATKLKLL